MAGIGLGVSRGFIVCSLLDWITWKIRIQLLDKMTAKYVPGPEEAEQLILEAITKITSAKSKQRTMSEKICVASSRSHGLDESVIMLQSKSKTNKRMVLNH